MAQLTKQKASRTHATKTMVITGMFTALLCVLAQISLPTAPIPFTLALYGIFLIGGLLPPKAALLSVFSYLLLGAFGLPVFAGFRGGFHVLTGMTGGFLMAFPLMALITSLSWHLTPRYKPVSLTFGMVLSLTICYLIGSFWFSFTTDSTLYYALTVCVYPFILTDVIKIGLAVITGLSLRRSLLRDFEGL